MTSSSLATGEGTQNPQQVERTAEQVFALLEGLGHVSLGGDRGKVIGPLESYHLELPYTETKVFPVNDDPNTARLIRQRTGLVAWRPRFGGAGLVSKYDLITITASKDPDTGKPAVEGTKEKVRFFGLRDTSRPLKMSDIKTEIAKAKSAADREK
ncbi:MAG TPA: hypothetical protein VIJ68_00370 [Candidatus Saccharimonadales bacterium]